MKVICDGHEYSVTDDSYRDGHDIFTVKNNYGKPVATLSRTVNDEYWALDLIGGERIASWHENEVIDNTLAERIVQAYVAWAMDNDTVEEHS